jgi:hypothetical protein
MTANSQTPRSESTLLHRIYPWLIELWIASVLVGFFVVRVLGSSLGHRVLSAFGIHAAP